MEAVRQQKYPIDDLTGLIRNLWDLVGKVEEDDGFKTA